MLQIHCSIILKHFIVYIYFEINCRHPVYAVKDLYAISEGLQQMSFALQINNSRLQPEVGEWMGFSTRSILWTYWHTLNKYLGVCSFLP